ncbi:MAG: hypothetical protein WAM28_03925 [Chlamydiales bacterium]
MSSLIKNISSANTEDIYPQTQHSEAKVSYRSTGGGKRARVMNHGDSKIETLNLIFDNFLAVLPLVTAFATEKEYSRMLAVSRKVKEQVCNIQAANIRLKEVWRCELPFILSPKDYTQLIKHKKAIHKIVYNKLRRFLALDALDFIEVQKRFNSEEAARTLKSLLDAIETEDDLVKQYKLIVKMAQAAAGLGLTEEAKKLLLQIPIPVRQAQITSRNITDSIEKAQTCLESIERTSILQSIDVNAFMKGSIGYIDFFIKRWKAAPEEADGDIIEMRKAIDKADNSLNKIIGELLIIIASASAKIDTGNTPDNLKKACEIISGIEDLWVKFEFLRIMVIKGFILNPEEVIRVFKEIYERFESEEMKFDLIHRLREIDLKKTLTIPDEMIVSNVQNPFHQAMILTWIAGGYAAVSPEKSEKIVNGVLEVLDQFEVFQKEEIRLAFAKSLLETDPKKAYEIVRHINFDDPGLENELRDFFKEEKSDTLIKSARTMVKQAKTEEDLNQAAKVFKEAQDLLTEYPSEESSSDDFNLLLDLLYFSIPVFE